MSHPRRPHRTALQLALAVSIVSLALPGTTRADEPPAVLYTDVLSGPNTGGENNLGTYLSIFGRNFGSSQGSSKVYINNQEVAAYKYWGPSRGRPDVQQISVQPGPNVTSGAIRVVVSGQSSNVDHTFAVRPGDIYFVSQSGSDDNGAIGNINKPFRKPQNTFDRSDYGPGDVIVIRGGTWTDRGSYEAFVALHNKQGTAENPMVIMGYPGETVNIATGNGRSAFHLYSNDGSQQRGFTVSNFKRLDGGCFAFRKASDTADANAHLRFVNSECAGLHGSGGGTGNIAGSGDNVAILGNNIHDNGDTKLYHGIYINNDNGEGDTCTGIELAYNHIHDHAGGRGILVYHGSGLGATFFDVRIHGNLIHDIALHAIVVSDKAASAKIYNNVMYNLSVSSGDGTKGGIQLKNPELVAEVYNNTMYNVERGSAFDNQRATSLVVKNNIFAVLPGQGLFENANSGDYDWNTIINASNNIWTGGGSLPSWDSGSSTANPQFANPAGADFHLAAGSPAIDAGAAVTVGTDHDGVPRPRGPSIDIGAYEGAGSSEPPPIPSPPSTPQVE